MDDVLKKILDIKSQKGINDRNFARLLGLRDGIVSDWKSGRSKSYLKYLTKISQILNVEPSAFLNSNRSSNKILKHDGTSISFDKEKIERAIFGACTACRGNIDKELDNIYYEETYDINECYILKRFRRLNSSGRKRVMEYIDDISETPKYIKK